jgi:hypothetical protein
MDGITLIVLEVLAVSLGLIYVYWVQRENRKTALIVEKAKATHELCMSCPEKVTCHSLCARYVAKYGKDM